METELVLATVRDRWLLVLPGAISLALLFMLLRRRKDRVRKRPPLAVVVASFAAIGCTAYSADTSWRFAEHRLDMTEGVERGVMFAAAELALFACALMARQNLRERGTPGTPGLLVWAVTLVQVIPAYTESGVLGGTVRAVVGPVLAAVLWHMAMGLELWHAKPGALSSSLPAVIEREVRERLLSRLGLATRDRTAEQITRDRATVRAVRLASRTGLRAWGKHRLAAAVARSGAGVDAGQRDVLLQLLAARRSAESLSTIVLPSPFEAEPEGGTAAEPVPARVVLVPVPDRDRRLVPAGAEPRPELQAVPEPAPEAEPKSAPEPARRNRRTTRKSEKNSAFNKHVRSARRWLDADPKLSGADIGKKLKTSDRYGRKVRTAALAEAS
ncbi:hypothetical protein ABZ953_06785 [Streptomyces sp. NPDC046465]|uniref:hypothetical protein n=1 Tax=Streptomyces sp. NPDC046465 TaxID=3155810 RepID=UPI003402F34A